MSDNVTVVIADGSEDFVSALTEILENAGRYKLVGTVSNGEEALRLIKKHRPELVIIDNVLPRLDGMSVLRMLRGLAMPWDPAVFLTPSFYTDAIIKEAMELDVRYVMPKPLHLPSLLGRIDALRDSKGSKPNTGLGRPLNLLLGRARDMLLENCILPGVKGYTMLRDAVACSAEKPSLLGCITKRLYPMLAEKYGCTAMCVERNIRRCISSGWEQSPLSAKRAYFGNAIERTPSNAEFIATLADRLLLDSDLMERQFR